MKIAISAESSADLTEELLEKYRISTVPFTVILGEKTYDDGEISCDDIIRFVDESKILPKTGAVNVYRFEEHFSKLLKDNDAVIHFSLSSQLSSAYNNALTAAKGFKNVYVVDSLSLSAGIGLLAIYGRKLADAGYSAAKIYEKTKSRVPFIQVSSELKRVDYLYKGGRCSALMYLGANILKIRPQILVKDGKLIAGKKYRGKFESVVERYCDDILEEFDNPDLEEAFIAYTTASPEIISIAYEKLKNKGFKNIHITQAGATVSSHTGEDCLGIYYINDGEGAIYNS